jgi:hypothetical protein
MPISIFATRKMFQVRGKLLKYTDERVKLTNELLQFIRAVKYYSWENFIVNRILGAREKELQGYLSILKKEEEEEKKKDINRKIQKLT